MKFPIAIDFRARKLHHYECGGYVMVLDLFGNGRLRHLVQVYLRSDIEAILDWPARQWRDLKHRYYYGRLEFQYQAGYADGLAAGLARPDVYDDLTPEERKALTSEPGSIETGRQKKTRIQSAVAKIKAANPNVKSAEFRLKFIGKNGTQCQALMLDVEFKDGSKVNLQSSGIERKDEDGLADEFIHVAQDSYKLFMGV